MGIKLRSLAPVTNDHASAAPGSEATEIRVHPHVVHLPRPARLPREAFTLLKRQGISLDLAESGVLPKQPVAEVEHESVMRAIPRAPAPPAPEPPMSSFDTQSIAVPKNSSRPRPFVANKALYGWLLLGLVAIALAATIPR